MLGTIAIDTRGFAPELIGQKYSCRDVRAVQKLHAVLSLTAQPPPPLPPLDADRHTTLAAAAALRSAPLPPAAAVGGAQTYAELATVLLDARSDVGSLSALELLRLDYKEAGFATGQRVGVAAITLTLEQLLSAAGGAAQLEAVMAAAMSAGGSAATADVLFAVTAADGAQAGQKHAVALAAPTDAAAALAAHLCASVATAPSWLPSSLATQSLFVAQAIGTEGFGGAWAALEGAEPEALLRVSALRGCITRKTFLPVLKAAAER